MIELLHWAGTIEAFPHLILIMAPCGSHIYYWRGNWGLGYFLESHPRGKLVWIPDQCCYYLPLPTASIMATVSSDEFFHAIWKWKQFNVFYSWLFVVFFQLQTLQHTGISNPFYHISLSVIWWIITFLFLTTSFTSKAQLFVQKTLCKIVNSRFSPLQIIHFFPQACLVRHCFSLLLILGLFYT